jgi:leucyl aminopeptidase
MLECYLETAPERCLSVVPLTKRGLDEWLESRDDTVKLWVSDTDFKAKPGTHRLVPGPDGRPGQVLLGVRSPDDFWTFGSLPGHLAAGAYRIDAAWSEERLMRAALGWGLGAYRFERYRDKSGEVPRLVLPCDYAALAPLVESTYLVRDLINTGPDDMMPEDVATAAEALAREHGATSSQLIGDELLAQNYPLVHAVGRASEHAPRLIDLRWGDETRPKLTLVGKGVCFDSGGLDIKPAQGMRLMKKDMGGAAHVLGLARMIMATRLPVRLRVLIPAVENAVAGNSFHPGDVIRSRKGLTVEIENTDAEGRLVLADALAEAASEEPDLLIDFATLTGAARVALGTDVPAFFTHDDELAGALAAASKSEDDPVWRLPLHEPYRRDIKSQVADVLNCSTTAFGGAITAALFLERFVPRKTDWVHIDVMAWNMSGRLGRPKGGEAMGLYAMFRYLQGRYGTRARA